MDPGSTPGISTKNKFLSKLLEKEQKSKNNWWKMLFGAVALMFLLADTFVAFSMWSVVSRVDQYNHGVVDEIGTVTGDVHKFADDLNEIRGFLLLPQRDYFPDDQNSGDQMTGEQESSAASQGLYAFLEQYQKDQTFQKNKDRAQRWLAGLKNPDNKDFNAALGGAKLAWGEENDGDQAISIKITDTQKNIYNLILDFRFGQMKVQSILGEENLGVLDQQVLLNYLKSNRDLIETKLKELEIKKSDLNSLMGDQEIVDLLKSKNLFVTDDFEDGENSYDKQIKQNDTVALTVQILKPDFVYKINSQQYQNIADLKPALRDTLKNLDLRTKAEKNFEAKKAELEQLMKEQAFMDLISQMNLEVQMPREENNKIVYDLKDKNDGQIKFSLAVEESSGHFKLIQNNQEIDLDNYQADDGSKKNF